MNLTNEPLIMQSTLCPIKYECNIETHSIDPLESGSIEVSRALPLKDLTRAILKKSDRLQFFTPSTSFFTQKIQNTFVNLALNINFSENSDIETLMVMLYSMGIQSFKN